MRARPRRVAMLAAMAVAATSCPAAAETRSVDVRTHSGLTLRINEALLTAAYTILPRPLYNQTGGQLGATPGQEAPPPPRPPAPNGAAGAAFGILFTSAAIGGSRNGNGQLRPDDMPDPMLAERVIDALTIARGDVEVRIPVEQLATLTIVRIPIASPLPSYVAGSHVRHAASAVLRDGSRIDGDYLSTGTIVLRGTTAAGRVQIPLEDVESLEFVR